MKEWLTAIASYVGANGLGTVGDDMFIGALEEEPYTQTAIIPTGGPEVPGDPLRRRTFQILHRNELKQQALTVATSIHALFDDKWNVLPAGHEGRFLPMHDIGPHFADENLHTIYSLNYVFHDIG
jgi:hypothetical protein